MERLLWALLYNRHTMFVSMFNKGRAGISELVSWSEHFCGPICGRPQLSPSPVFSQSVFLAVDNTVQEAGIVSRQVRQLSFTVTVTVSHALLSCVERQKRRKVE